MSRAWPFLTTQVLGQKPPTGTNLSAAQRRVTGCRRVDEPTSIRKFRVAPRASCGPLDRRPAAGSLSLSRSGRIGCCGEPGRQPAARRLPRCALFLLHCGLLYFARSHSPISCQGLAGARSGAAWGVGRWAAAIIPDPRSAMRMRMMRMRHAAGGGGRGARKRTESESKPESDFSGADLGVRSGRGPESPSPRKSPICFGLGIPSPRRSPICFGSESPSLMEIPICFGPESPTESESKGESDLARHLLRLDLLGRALFGPLRKRELF
jgi:hypothetical protein